ncbi:MAG: hypothetical protein HGB17_11580 [Syntrophobacteraceae bacterium]|nr:hypothetical protein [Syntrophobacteraceae bacterium]
MGRYPIGLSELAHESGVLVIDYRDVPPREVVFAQSRRGRLWPDHAAQAAADAARPRRPVLVYQ